MKTQKIAIRIKLTLLAQNKHKEESKISPLRSNILTHI